MEEILHQLIGSISHYLQGVLHPRWFLRDFWTINNIQYVSFRECNSLTLPPKNPSDRPGAKICHGEAWFLNFCKRRLLRSAVLAKTKRPLAKPPQSPKVNAKVIVLQRSQIWRKNTLRYHQNIFKWLEVLQLNEIICWFLIKGHGACW